MSYSSLQINMGVSAHDVKSFATAQSCITSQPGVSKQIRFRRRARVGCLHEVASILTHVNTAVKKSCP